MKILITSASSFVGRYIARKFLQDGHKVTGTYRTYSHHIKNLEQKYQMKTKKNIFSITSDIEILDDSFDVVINCSGAFINGLYSIEDIISLNIKNCYFIGKNIVSYKNFPKVIINLSTLSIYGDLKKPLINDNTLPSPSNIYGSSKLVGEHVLSELIDDKLPIVNIRLPAILGEGSHTAWLPSMVKKMQNNEEVRIFNPNSYYYACTTLNSLYKFINELTKADLKNKTFSFPVGAIGDLTIFEISEFLKRELNSLSKISINESKFPCCKIDSNIAKYLGYKFPTVSSSISYLIKTLAR